jgi:excisionase family DNA binding protein
MKSSIKPDVFAPLLLRANDAATTAGVSLRTIRQLVKDGELDVRYIGNGRKEYRITYESLVAWVDSLPTEKAAS